MQRKPGYPTANCNIKIPDSIPISEVGPSEDDGVQQQKRLQLINFGHSQWGFNNWSWTVSKQDLDFVDFSNGKYSAGVAAFVSVTVKSYDIHRENIGYATTVAVQKGSAIHQARKCAVTNALRETLLSFGGSVATDLMELLESNKVETNNPAQPPEVALEIQSATIKTEPKNAPIKNMRKDTELATNMRPPAVKNVVGGVTPLPANAPRVPLRAPHPLPPAPHPVPPTVHAVHPAPPPVHPAPPAGTPRPNSNDAKSLESMTDEEARAERKRRQRQAQEEFRLKQMMKQKDDNEEAGRNGSGFDSLLLAVPTQELEENGKRRSPGAGEGGTSKRRAGLTS